MGSLPAPRIGATDGVDSSLLKMLVPPGLETHYVDGGLKRARPLPKLRGLSITSVAWSPALRAGGFRWGLGGRQAGLQRGVHRHLLVRLGACICKLPCASYVCGGVLGRSSPAARSTRLPVTPLTSTRPPSTHRHPLLCRSEALLGTDSGALYELALEPEGKKETLRLLYELRGETGGFGSRELNYQTAQLTRPLS